MMKRKTFIVLIVILQIFTQLCYVECRPKAKKGKGKAFGAGILAGGLAGAAMGHLLTRQNNPAEVHHHHHIVDPNAAASNTAVSVAPSSISVARPSTIIERGETLANGCYKETVKEPDIYDVTRFVETEKLICPTNSQVPVVPVVPVSQVQAQTIPELPPKSPQAPPNISTNSESMHTASLVPLPPTISEPQQNHAGAPVVSDVRQYLPQPTQSPVSAIASPPPSSMPGQVIVLSKKTGSYEEDKMKKNFAGNLLATNFGLLLLLAGLLYLI